MVNEKEHPEIYIAQPVAILMRRQAFRVWGGFSLFVLAWAGLLALAPVFLSAGYQSVSGPIYKFCSYICHQLPERSLHLAGHQFAVCSRCFGVYAGLFLGFAVYPLWRKVEDIEPLPRKWLFLSMIPIGIDWALTIFGIWENTHLSRTVTGLTLGFACGTYIIPALVEIFRYMTLRSRRV